MPMNPDTRVNICVPGFFRQLAADEGRSLNNLAQRAFAEYAARQHPKQERKPKNASGKRQGRR
jgi:hypothetical protein